jgi:hypothetical protein
MTFNLIRFHTLLPQPSRARPIVKRRNRIGIIAAAQETISTQCPPNESSQGRRRKYYPVNADADDG